MSNDAHCDEAGNVIETHSHAGQFKGAVSFFTRFTPNFSLKEISHDSAFVELLSRKQGD
jgi:hypothetical protein